VKVKKYYRLFKGHLKDFTERISKESDETKEAFGLLVNSMNNKTKLTPKEKEQIGNQMKDVLKTIGIVGVTLLPGGSIFLILSKVLKINKYVLPSSFLEEKKKIED
jgi:Mg2+ and Co2+ transporter CorA